jgi:hypothetical protein
MRAAGAASRGLGGGGGGGNPHLESAVATVVPSAAAAREAAAAALEDLRRMQPAVRRGAGRRGPASSHRPRLPARAQGSGGAASGGGGGRGGGGGAAGFVAVLQTLRARSAPHQPHARVAAAVGLWAAALTLWGGIEAQLTRRLQRQRP